MPSGAVIQLAVPLDFYAVADHYFFLGQWWASANDPDTHPFLSPNDEWADFEIRPFKLGPHARSNPSGSYVRDALLRGLAFAESLGINPYQYGILGSSDSHSAGQTYSEENFTPQRGGRAAAETLGSVPVDAAGVG